MLRTLLIFTHSGRSSALEYHIEGGVGIIHHPAGGAVIFKPFVYTCTFQNGTFTILEQLPFFGNCANL